MDYNNPNTPPPGPGNPNPATDVERGRTIAILSYCTLIGWIIAIVMHQNEKTKFGAYHIRQGLGAMIIFFCLWILVFFFGMFVFHMWFLIRIVQLLGLALIVMGIINAANGKTQPLPVIGEISDKMLAGIQ